MAQPASRGRGFGQITLPNGLQLQTYVNGTSPAGTPVVCSGGPHDWNVSQAVTCFDPSTGNVVPTAPVPQTNTPSVGIPGYDLVNGQLPPGFVMDQSNGFQAPGGFQAPTTNAPYTQPAQVPALQTSYGTTPAQTTPMVTATPLQTSYGTTPAQTTPMVTATPTGTTAPATTSSSTDPMSLLLMAAAVGLMFLL